ncbi:Hypothetical predicted protein [Pelobates cultripes]|uniref:Uncharacterized protein n=1 Tax=Pelobates cultripes TaxID=61616 RepID=A0AAD1W9J7_PELCU|nr:Hypothetical predicted protein [Pelobates cultripes]
MARSHRAKEPLVGQKRPGYGSGLDPEEEYEELDYASDEEAGSEEGAPPAVAPRTGGAFPAGGVAAQGASGDAGILDPQGNPLFDPDDLRHPRSAEWEPPEHIARYIALRMRTPLSRESRSKLRAECPRPSTPEVDPQIAQFLNKSGWKQKKGLDFSLRHSQRGSFFPSRSFQEPRPAPFFPSRGRSWNPRYPRVHLLSIIHESGFTGHGWP